MSHRQFNLTLTVDINPDVWEGAGYDPLDENPAVAARQVADFFATALFAGSDHLPAEVGRIIEANNPGRVTVYPSAEGSGLVTPGLGPSLVSRGESHLVTIVSRGDKFVARNAQNQELDFVSRVKDDEAVGLNYPALMRLFSNALDKVS